MELARAFRLCGDPSSNRSGPCHERVRSFSDVTAESEISKKSIRDCRIVRRVRWLLRTASIIVRED